jgi:hypothetical protein
VAGPRSPAQHPRPRGGRRFRAEGGATVDELTEQLHRHTGLRGLAKARQALPLLDGRSRSRPESRIRTALVLADLPKPDVNVAIYDEHGQWLAEPDLSYDEAKLAIEFNGADHAEARRMRKDSIRTLDMQRASWRTLVYTTPHAFGRLDEVVTDVYTELRRRAPHLISRTALRGRPRRSA